MHPRKFGRYEVLAEIGDGAMGRVYRAFDPLVRRPVAIKTVKSELLAKDSAEEYLRRFRREAQAAGGLNHPHIVSVFDVGEDYFVMEFLEGVTLQALLKEKGRLEPPEALRILTPVAEALDFAHRTGIVHRDIKPANIMVAPDGRPKLMDFGVAHLESTVMTAAGQFLGSPSYMAPEQMTSGDVTARSDLFSLAIVAYETLTGQKPFPGENITSVMYKVIHEAAAPPRKWNFELPPRYDDVFAKALAKASADRYPTAGAFVAALDLKELDTAIASAIDSLTTEPAAPGPAETPAGTTDAPPSDARPGPSDSGAGRITPPVATFAGPTPPAAAPMAKKGRGLAVAAVVVIGLAAVAGIIGLARRGGSRTTGAAGVVNELATTTTLAPVRPSLRIETDPDEALVYVDGEEAGRTPLSIADVGVGSHKVRVTSEGFAPTELSIDVFEGKEPAPLRFVLQPVSAKLVVKSEPAGASVRVGGKKSLGKTPLEGVWLPPGTHEVRLELKGHKPFTQRVSAEIGETVTVTARLEADVPKRVAHATPSPESLPSAEPTPLAEGTLVEFGPDVTPPVRISGEIARYPEQARRARKSGTVTVEFVVTEKGETTDIKVVESVTEVLDKAVVDSVRTWRWEPAKKQGVKVKVKKQARQTFK